MQINRNDLLKMYGLGIVSILIFGLITFLLLSFVSGLAGIISYLGYAVIFGIPLSYYLKKNCCDLKSAVLISFLLGLTLFLVYILFLVWPLSIILTIVLGLDPPSFSQFSTLNWTKLLLERIWNGIVAAVIGIALYFYFLMERKTQRTRRLK